MLTASGFPYRKRIRLRGFPYGGGCAYYLTLCADHKRMLFGSCFNGVVALNAIGRIVEASWLRTAALRSEVVLDESIVMPNHMHAIVHVPPLAAKGALFRGVGGFKASVTSAVRRLLATPEFVVWQKRFYDRIVREGEIEGMRE